MSELPLASRKTVEEQIKAILIDELSILEDRTLARVERRLLAVVNANEEKWEAMISETEKNYAKHYSDEQAKLAQWYQDYSHELSVFAKKAYKEMQKL